MLPGEASSHHHAAALFYVKARASDRMFYTCTESVTSVQALEVSPEMAEEEVKVLVVVSEGIRFMDGDFLWFSPLFSLHC